MIKFVHGRLAQSVERSIHIREVAGSSPASSTMLTGVVLTHNSQSTLDSCLASLKFCDHLLVVDDYSTDATRSIALKHGAKFLTHALESDFAAQHNFGLDQLPDSTWALFVHADEIIPPQLGSAIVSALTDPNYQAYCLYKLDHVFGVPIKYGDCNNAKFIRLAKVGQGRWVGRIHEHWRVVGPTGELKPPYLHYPHPNLKVFLSKLNFYSSLRAQELSEHSSRPSFLPVLIYPPIKFFYNWIFKLGFLDGEVGFIHAMAMALYSFLVRGKLYLLSRGIKISD